MPSISKLHSHQLPLVEYTVAYISLLTFRNTILP